MPKEIQPERAPALHMALMFRSCLPVEHGGAVLAQENESSCLGKLPGSQLVEVHAARKPGRVPGHPVLSSIHLVVHEGHNLLAEDVVDGQGGEDWTLQIEAYCCSRIKGIGVVLVKGEDI